VFYQLLRQGKSSTDIQIRNLIPPKVQFKLCAIVDKTLGTEVLRAPDFTAFFYGDLIKRQGIMTEPWIFFRGHQACQIVDIFGI